MAQRDYVRCSQPASSRRKKGHTRNTKPKNKPNGSSVASLTVVAIAAAVVVAFIGGLYFITHHKKETTEVSQNRQATVTLLPPKPEERWRYIKELENRQPEIRQPTEPTAGGEVVNTDQLTAEQRKMLAQIQADMRQQPTRLAEVPWNQQTESQRLAQQQSRAQQQGATVLPSQKPALRSTPAISQPNQALAQTLAATPPKPPSDTSATRVEEDKKENRNWFIQCGSFKNAEQAETARAQLAFEGFASRITINNGWNRVVIDPRKGKDNAENLLERLKIAGHANCIRLVTRG
ncbi:cell division protein FtsN [Enterobacteriaceae bacterium ESL0689]|nr:cell division protein FtsN [Enterobacteriaceae bacterium ESL0689]